ncbi:class I SAM-dependent methyltransferase [Agromyces sp. H66]|uniref:class I SAM-dependent methyltransferase n=1 Tax=Agromyces sp. H66 TaxID=2529859 RepID=UPI0010A9F511|nr:class I SAM-dependent methyltransferase [Agromyces sp. H66]
MPSTLKLDLDLVRSPKLAPTQARRWYRYYAGYAPEFVDDVCGQLDATQRVLDPWMGSGTTLAVAASHGHTASGLDLNPTMVVIAKGRLLADDTIASVDAICSDLLRYLNIRRDNMETEPLTQWFTPATASTIRAMASRIDELLIAPVSAASDKANAMSSLAAFFYVALFEATTAQLKTFQSRNPTWLKRGEQSTGAISVNTEEIASAFIQSVRRLKTHVATSGRITTRVRNRASLLAGDSRSLPFDDDSHDLVISSPPYLTRLDYVVGHLAELAVLGSTGLEIRALRDSMIGTPTMGRSIFDRNLGAVTEALLDRVTNHPSRAASTYYEPNFRRYFEGMQESLKEIQRVCRPDTNVVLVVQDSRFKDVHIDLASALTDMAQHLGWRKAGQRDFVNVRSMAQLNKRAHTVARTTKPIESVLNLVTPSR